MNFLFIIGIYPGIGGTERVTSLLANRLHEDGHKVIIASFKQSACSLEDCNENIRLLKLCSNTICSTNVKILRRCIVNNNINYIINQWCLPFTVSLLLNLARKGTDCKLISVLHGMPNNSKILISLREQVNDEQLSTFHKALVKLKLWSIDKIIRFSCKYVYNKSDRYVLLSESFKSEFTKYSGIIDDTKLCAIGNPLTIASTFDYSLIESKKKEVLYVGRIDLKNKRVDRIIDAWGAVSNSHKDWSLVIVGDGPDRLFLMNYVKESKIERVRFTGFVKEDPIEFYKNAAILMLTSDLEGFGLVIVEGMSYGCVPIVYGSYTAVFDIISDAYDGYITPMPYSHDITVDRLSSLMENNNEIKRMAERAIKKSEQFSMDQTIKQWYKLFNDLE